MKYGIFLLFLSATILSGCVGLQKKTPEIPTVKTDLDSESLSRSEYYEQMGLSYAQEGLSEKAVEQFQLSLLHDPENVPARVALAAEYMKDGRKHMAITELDAAHDRQPGNFTVLRRMGELYVSSGIYLKAREVYEYMLSLKPNDEKPRWALVQIAKTEKKYDEALGRLDELARVSPELETSGRIAYEKARVHRAAGQNELYGAALTEAYRRNPRDGSVVRDYADWSVHRDTPAAAVQALAQYTQTQPYDESISRRLADAAIQAGRYDLALTEIDRQIEAGHGESLGLKKAHVYYMMGEYVSAAAAYEAVLEDYPSDEAAYYLGQIRNAGDAADREEARYLFGGISPASDYYGRARSVLARYERAEDNTEGALEIMKAAYDRRRDQIDIYRTYGDLLLENGKYPDAARVLQNGIAEFPRDEDLRIQAAFAYYRLNRFADFNEQVRAVEKLNPQNGDVYAMLAGLWHADGKNLNELSFLVRKAAELKSANKNVRPLLAWVLMQQKRTADAVALFEEAYEKNPEEAFLARSLAQIYSAAEIRTRAREMSRVAAALELNQNFRSGTYYEETLVPAENTLRLPAAVKD